MKHRKAKPDRLPPRGAMHAAWRPRVAFSLYCLLSILSWPARADSVAPWFAQLMADFAAIPQRFETFREEKRLAALTRPLSVEGELVYRRPSHFEKITLRPRTEVVLVDGDQLTLTGSDGTPHEVSLAAHPEIGTLVDAVAGTLAGDIARLERSYSIRPSGDTQAWQMDLLPTNRRVQDLLRQIVIRGTGTSISSILIEQTNGDSQTMTVARRADIPPVTAAFAGTVSEGEHPPPPVATSDLIRSRPARSGPKP